MPCVCRFAGIKIHFYYDEHPPPHFHAIKGGEVAVVELVEDDHGNEVVRVAPQKNGLKRSDVRKVVDWAADRYDQLVQQWRKAANNQQLDDLDPP